jgi:hypothetical protein
VSSERIELPTFSISASCSNRLSYDDRLCYDDMTRRVQESNLLGCDPVDGLAGRSLTGRPTLQCACRTVDRMGLEPMISALRAR